MMSTGSARTSRNLSTGNTDEIGGTISERPLTEFVGLGAGAPVGAEASTQRYWICFCDQSRGTVYLIRFSARSVRVVRLGGRCPIRCKVKCHELKT